MLSVIVSISTHLLEVKLFRKKLLWLDGLPGVNDGILLASYYARWLLFGFARSATVLDFFAVLLSYGGYKLVFEVDEHGYHF